MTPPVDRLNAELRRHDAAECTDPRVISLEYVAVAAAEKPALPFHSICGYSEWNVVQFDANAKNCRLLRCVARNYDVGADA
ncbi:hypothetical protein GNP10_14645 [Escherichia coli]|nr:hypothetical protein [Escherichia coli]